MGEDGFCENEMEIYTTRRQKKKKKKKKSGDEGGLEGGGVGRGEGGGVRWVTRNKRRAEMRHIR